MQYSQASSRPQAPPSGGSRVTRESIAEDEDSDDDFLAQARCSSAPMPGTSKLKAWAP